MPMMARHARPCTLLLSALLLGACGGELTSPTAMRGGLTPDAASMAKGGVFSPGKGNKKVLAPGEVAVYTFTIDPNVDNQLDMGGINALTLPANAVCAAGSSYGTAYWDSSCAPATLPVTITATLTGTNTGKARVEFQPAMRFNPAASPVTLYMFAKHADAADAKAFTIQYCPTDKSHPCYDESLTDASLVTKFSTKQNEVYRRIKHFSGYVVVSRDELGNELPL